MPGSLALSRLPFFGSVAVVDVFHTEAKSIMRYIYGTQITHDPDRYQNDWVESRYTLITKKVQDFE